MVGNASPVADGTWRLLLDDVVGNASPAAGGPWLLLLDDVAGTAPLVAESQSPLLYRPRNDIACAGNRERASDATATPMAERWTIDWINYG